MSWRSFQNKNKLHKDNFQKKLGETIYKPFDDCDKEYYTFLYSLFMKITDELRGYSEKEWTEMFRYQLQDLGFIVPALPLYFTCFVFFRENQICLISKSPNPSLLFKLKEEGHPSIIVICPQHIKEYCFTESGCVVRHL